MAATMAATMDLADFAMTIEGNDAPVDTPGSLVNRKHKDRGGVSEVAQSDADSDSSEGSASEREDDTSGNSHTFSFNIGSGDDDDSLDPSHLLRLEGSVQSVLQVVERRGLVGGRPVRQGAGGDGARAQSVRP